MPSEPFSEVKLEIGHVLFIDIVGYLCHSFARLW